MVFNGGTIKSQKWNLKCIKNESNFWDFFNIQEDFFFNKTNLQIFIFGCNRQA
jgi:hypothetical protein